MAFGTEVRHTATTVVTCLIMVGYSLDVILPVAITVMTDMRKAYPISLY